MTILTKNHATLVTEVKAHIAADAVVQGRYWRDGKGCFIGCLAHSSDATVLEEKYGLPLPLVKICEQIFESLPESDARAFFAAIPEAVGCDGKDLTRVHWAFLASELRALPAVPPKVQSAIDPVIAGMDRLAAGDSWPGAYDAAARVAAYAASAARAAALAAAHAAYAAYAAYAADAARAAAYAARAADAARAARAADAAYAAHAAHAAAVNRQRDTVLNLIRTALVVA